MNKLEWPQGATHVRLTSGNKSATIVKKDAVSALKGVEGALTFLRREKLRGKPESFTPFAGGDIPNPYANDTVEASTTGAEAKSKRKTKTATNATNATGRKREGKGAFIESFLMQFASGSTNTSKFTARDVLPKFLAKFPGEGNADEQEAKAIALIRATLAHAKVREGKAYHWASEVEARHATTTPKPRRKKAEKAPEKLTEAIACVTSDVTPTSTAPVAPADVANVTPAPESTPVQEAPPMSEVPGAAEPAPTAPTAPATDVTDAAPVNESTAKAA